MLAINKPIKILLVDNKQTDSNSIERFLSNAKAQNFQLTKIKNLAQIRQRIQQSKPDLIFQIFNQHLDDNLSQLQTLQQSNELDIPLIIISYIIEFDFKSLTVDVDDYLVWSELSTALLEKTIFFALKRAKNRRETELISEENIDLSSQLLTTKNLFQTIIDNTSTLIWMCDAQGKNTFFNQAWSRFLGGKCEVGQNINWMLNIHPQDLAKCQHKFNQSLTQQQGFTISYRLKSFDGQYRWISNYAVPQFTVKDEFEGLVGYCFDITAHKKTEQKLIQKAISDRLLAQITQKIHASLDLDQILPTAVSEVNRFLQAEKIQINKIESGNKLRLLFESRLNEQTLKCDIANSQRFPVLLLQNNLAQLEIGQSVTDEYIIDSAIGAQSCSVLMVSIISEQKLWGTICIESCSVPRKWHQEEIRLIERVSLELSVAIKQAKLYQQLNKANKELEQLSAVDGLTQIANRRKFDQYLVTEWNRAFREQNPLSVILCDIDHFKLYNDTYGHQAGDLCLQKVALAISKVTKRPADLVARYGGEEFVLVLPNTDLEGANCVAQQVRWQIQALQLPHINSSVDLYVTLSLGVSCCIPCPKFSFEMLVAAADKGLYLAKETGRNRVVEYKIKP